MTSIAPLFRPPLTPSSSKKRGCAELSPESGRLPKKRLQSLNLPPRFSGTILKPSMPITKSAAQLTGLEGHLKLDIDFVEASKATQEDEAKRSILSSGESSYRVLLAERRHLSSKVTGSWPDISGESRGLKNLTGALCYRHSLFQALLHTPKFVYWLLDFHSPEDCVSDHPRTCVSCQMRELVCEYWDPQLKNSDVTNRLDLIDDLFELLGWKTHSNNGHADPDEQFAWMLDIMRTEMPSSVFSYFDAFHNSLLESEIKCGRCGHASKTLGNDERHLSVPIKVPDLPARHLQLLIKAYMEEVIQGYRCENEKCKHVSDNHRIQKIAYAPDVLLIQLKRFNYRGQKDSTRVQYGPRLDLSPHSANTSLGPLSYDLMAVISHAGTSNFGHYQCMAKTPNGTWCEFDDMSMTPVGIKYVLNPGFIEQDWTPYLLFYVRNETSMPPA